MSAHTSRDPIIGITSALNDSNHEIHSGVTVLMIPAGRSSLQICQVIIDHGADINAYNTFGITSLTEAIHWGYKESKCRLLAKGPDPDWVEGRSGHLEQHAEGITDNQRIIPLNERDVAGVEYGRRAW